MEEIEQQNQEAAQSYITAAEFDEFKKNILGTLLKYSEDITRIDNALIAVKSDIHNIKTKDER